MQPQKMAEDVGPFIGYVCGYLTLAGNRRATTGASQRAKIEMQQRPTLFAIQSSCVSSLYTDRKTVDHPMTPFFHILHHAKREYHGHHVRRTLHRPHSQRYVSQTMLRCLQSIAHRALLQPLRGYIAADVRIPRIFQLDRTELLAVFSTTGEYQSR